MLLLLGWFSLPPFHVSKYIAHTLSFHNAALTEYHYNFVKPVHITDVANTAYLFSKYGIFARFSLDS